MNEKQIKENNSKFEEDKKRDKKTNKKQYQLKNVVKIFFFFNVRRTFLKYILLYSFQSVFNKI